MNTGTDFAKHLSKFLSEYLPYERNMSPNTVASYRDTFVQYINYMKDVQNVKVERLTLDMITRQRVLDFLSWIQKERCCGITTRNQRLASIHSFISYLQYEDIHHLDEWQKIRSIKAMKDEKKSISYLTTEAIKLLLEQPDSTTGKGRRNLALLALMYDTGARVQEMIDLTPESLKIDSKPYTIRLFGKGRKSRIVPLMEEQIVILKRYMEENHLFENHKQKHPLFFNSRNEKLTRAGVTYILKTYADMARQVNQELIPCSIRCHSLRHSKAMHLLQSGVNIVYIRDLLGHVSTQTTDIYARADSKQKREALEKAYLDLVPEKAKKRDWDKNQDLLNWLKSLQH
jgi:integrase/recombinase XerD